jgi:hypothetical protein
MKTTPEEFERFKKEFKRWAELFGCTGYDIRISHKTPKGYKDAAATTETDEVDKIATITYTRNLNKEQQARHTPEGDAKHEAIHLLLSHLSWLANERFVGPDAIENEEEKIVYTLCGLLK